MNQLPVYSRPFDDDDFEELSLDDEHVELASELREYSEDDYDDEFTEQERRELIIAPLPSARPVAPPPTPKVAAVRRVELEPPPQPAFVLGPGQLPPRPSKALPQAKKAAAPTKKSVPAKKAIPAKKATAPVKKPIAPAKKAAAPAPPAKKVAAKKAASAQKPAKTTPAKNTAAKKN